MEASRLANRAWRIALFLAALVAAAFATLALAARASAVTTETFNFTGFAQTWTVPDRVTEATFDLYGAQGGRLSAPSGVSAAAPGLGGRATATIPVTPGDSIQVNVGGRGSGSKGGFNGGGGGATALGYNGGGGGGASDVRIGGTALTDRVLAAGGGGGGGFSCATGDVSHGGGLAGLSGGSCSGSGFGVAGGGGGSQTTGGSATAPARQGVAGLGGAGGVLVGFPIGGGGGGGGGWFGGGGGVLYSGGGGSGHGPAGTDFATGVREGDGLVTVSYTQPPPPPPSNEFSFGKVKKNERKGTATLTVEVPGPGELDLAQTDRVRADEETAAAAGEEKLIVRPRRGAEEKLGADGWATVNPKVTFTPTGGSPNTKRKQLKLIERYSR